MCVHLARYGISRVEIFVVLGIIAMLILVVFPVIARHKQVRQQSMMAARQQAIQTDYFSVMREKARTATCMSNVRQLEIAVQSYSQDHDGQYPGMHWDTAIKNQYSGNNNMSFVCPSDSSASPCNSYGYSGLLVKKVLLHCVRILDSGRLLIQGWAGAQISFHYFLPAHKFEPKSPILFNGSRTRSHARAHSP